MDGPLGEDADFDLITNISDASGGFTRRIYESGIFKSTSYMKQTRYRVF